MTAESAVSSTVVAVGSFPPPVHGAALVTQRVVDRLAPEARVVVADVEPGSGPARPVRKALRYGVALWRVLRSPRRSAVYVAASGGEAILADAAVVGLARLLRRPAVLHHHSTRYLRRRFRTMATLCRVGGPGLAHVVLCDDMVGPLRRYYPMVGEVLVVGNAGIIPPGAAHSERPAGGPVRLGHLSNLSVEKGMADVVELARRLRDDGRDVTVELAGPVADDEARAVLGAAVDDLGDRLLLPGALDEAQKAAFFARIDVFVFPSRYRHEAQPLVVYEAMAQGVPVIATDVGCLPDQVPADGGLVVPAGEDVADAAAAALDRLLTPAASAAARQAHVDHREVADAQLAALCERLARP
jgi:glycosyltransferase involved in cell wall biosynthesis